MSVKQASNPSCIHYCNCKKPLFGNLAKPEISTKADHRLETNHKGFTSTCQANGVWGFDNHAFVWSIPFTFDTDFSSSEEDEQRDEGLSATTDDDDKCKRQPPQIGQGSALRPRRSSESSRSHNPPPAVECAAPGHSLASFCLLFAAVGLYVVVRFAESISSLGEMRTRSQASALIRRCPVTAVSGIRTCGCRYPILHLCHSAPTDQQSNFTQARSEGGDADAGMRIYASTKTRSCLKWLEGWWSGGGRDGLKN